MSATRSACATGSAVTMRMNSVMPTATKPRTCSCSVLRLLVAAVSAYHDGGKVRDEAESLLHVARCHRRLGEHSRAAATYRNCAGVARTGSADDLILLAERELADTA